MDKITRDNWPEDWSKVPSWTEIDKEVYEHFFNCLPPISWNGDYFQCSEPYTHEPNEMGRWLAKYLTFTKKDGKCWYLGILFKGRES